MGFFSELGELPEGEKKYSPVTDASNPVIMTPVEMAKRELMEIEAGSLMDEEELMALDAQRKAIQDELTKVMQKMKEIENRKFYARSKIQKAKERLTSAELVEAEEIRARRMQEELVTTYENLKAYAKELNPYWLPFAMKHQWEAAIQIALNGSLLLADGMGLGKTLEVIMAADLLKARKVLVVAPNDMALTFADEFKMWAPHRTVIPLKSATKHMKEFIIESILSDPDEDCVLVMNYESLWEVGRNNQTDFVESLRDFGFDLMIMDEAHLIKNTKGLSFDRIATIREGVKNCVPVSGTFILNVPQDIWPNLNMVDPRVFFDKATFLRTYCQQSLYTGKWEFKSGGEKSLLIKLGGRIIRRTIEDTDIVLPPQFINKITIPMAEVSEEQANVMEQLRRFGQLILSKVDPETGEPKKMSVAAQIAEITRNRQAACYPAGIKIKESEYDDEGKKIPGTERVVFDVAEETNDSIKLDYAVRMLMEQKNKYGRRVVVFSQFKTALDELARRLKEAGMRVAQFDGSTKDKDRAIIKKDFLRPQDKSHKKDFKFDAVLANYKTGGVGLTFTEATYTLILDREWNPGKEKQAYARTCRIGQSEETYVDILQIENSIDFWMDSLNEMKEAIMSGFEGEIDMQSSLLEFFTTGKTEVEIESPVIIEGELELEEVS